MILVPVRNLPATIELYNLALIEHKLVILTGVMPGRWSN